MMLAQVALVVSIKREAGPAGDREKQANAGGGQAKQDADPDGERHSEEHPNEAGSQMAFVNVAKPWHYGEQRRDLVFRADYFRSRWKGDCIHISAPSLCGLTIPYASSTRR